LEGWPNNPNPSLKGDRFDGTEFGGTCLYACQDGKWDAYTIKPSESRDIITAEAWLVKRKWRAWG
jgi:hypothetical protein